MAYTALDILEEIKHRLPFAITTLVVALAENIVKSALDELDRVHQNISKELLSNIPDLSAIQMVGNGRFYDYSVGEDKTSRISVRVLQGGGIYSEGYSHDQVLIYYAKPWNIDDAVADNWTRASFLDFVVAYAKINMGNKLLAGDVIEELPFDLKGPDIIQQGDDLVEKTITFLKENSLWPIV